MIVAGYLVTLPVGAVLADLEASEIVGDQSEPASAENEGRDTDGDTGPERMTSGGRTRCDTELIPIPTIRSDRQWRIMTL